MKNMKRKSNSLWRLIDTDVAEPHYTAALDEAILVERTSDNVPNTLHFYRRKPPAISLGYFQDPEEEVNIKLCKKAGVELLRRASGGGAIYTDEKQLIFAVAYKETTPQSIVDSYKTIGDVLITTLSEFSLNAKFKPINDVLINGKKISGSAQTRKAGTILHHGTIIVDCDFENMTKYLKFSSEKNAKNSHKKITGRVTSLAMELGKAPNMGDVKASLLNGFEKVFGVKIVNGSLTNSEKKLAAKLAQTKYGKEAWTYGRYGKLKETKND
jgi:lipoate-protein ligase A